MDEERDIAHLFAANAKWAGKMKKKDKVAVRIEERKRARVRATERHGDLCGFGVCVRVLARLQAGG